MTTPTELKFAPSHEWVKVEADGTLAASEIGEGLAFGQAIERQRHGRGLSQGSGMISAQAPSCQM